MTKALRVADYLGHMIQAIDRVGRYTTGMHLAGFLSSDLVQDAVVRNIEIIGEAANNIQRVDPAFTARHDHIPWHLLYAMRNRISHGYDKVDLEIVWKTIERDLPALKQQIQGLPPEE